MYGCGSSISIGPSAPSDLADHRTGTYSSGGLWQSGYAEVQDPLVQYSRVTITWSLTQRHMVTVIICKSWKQAFNRAAVREHWIFRLLDCNCLCIRYRLKIWTLLYLEITLKVVNFTTCIRLMWLLWEIIFFIIETGTRIWKPLFTILQIIIWISSCLLGVYLICWVWNCCYCSWRRNREQLTHISQLQMTKLLRNNVWLSVCVQIVPELWNQEYCKMFGNT